MSMYLRSAGGAVLLLAVITATTGCGGGGGEPQATASAARESAPRNGLILYQKQVQGRYQLFTIRPDGSGERQVTHVPGEAIDPDWSPDGKRIVFQHDRPNEKGCAVMLVDADGGNLTDLSVGRDCDLQPSFTPDGKRIVFVRYNQKADKESIQSMDLTGGDARFIRDGNNEEIDPNVSPDGRTITFLKIKKEDELQALFAMDIDGTDVRRITPYTDEVARKHSWAPDGSRIGLTVNADFPHERSANILTIKPDGSGRTRVTRYSGGPAKGLNAFFGSYSPDGKHIVLRVERNDRGGLAIADPDGRNLRMITPIADPKPKAIDWGTANAGPAATTSTTTKPAVTAATPQAAPTTANGTAATSAVDGVYRSDVTLDQLQHTRGFDWGENNRGNAGRFRLTLRSGRYRLTGALDQTTQEGAFTLDGDRLTFHWFDGDFTYTWRLNKGALTLRKTGEGPTTFVVHPWRRARP